MLEEYANMPVRYRASFISGQLIVEEVTPHVYQRIGTAETGGTKREAIEILKLRRMRQFLQEMKAIDWQAMQYVPGT